MNHKIILIIALVSVMMVFTSPVFADTVKSGTLKTKCKPGQILMTNSHKNFCVKKTSVKKMISHGWSMVKLSDIKNDVVPKIKNPIPSLTNSNVMVGTSPDKDTNATMINKWYADNYVGIEVPEIGWYPLGGPLSVLATNYTITSTHPGAIKILLIGMEPNPPKAGENIRFSVTWKNISDHTIYQSADNGLPALGMVITPADKVRVGFVGYSDIGSGGTPVAPTEPGQIRTVQSGVDKTFGHFDSNHFENIEFSPGSIQVLKPGTLHVILELISQNKSGGVRDMMETIQFDVNATK
ncbi:MAG: hypothetical protein ACREAK_07010 [Nitrosarchaeum sp.]